MTIMDHSGTQKSIQEPEKKRPLCKNEHISDGQGHRPFGPNGRHVEICEHCGRIVYPKR